MGAEEVPWPSGTAEPSKKEENIQSGKPSSKKSSKK